jgi:hypothetical protein
MGKRRGGGVAQDSSASGIGPWQAGMGGRAVTQQGRVAGRDDPAHAQLTDRAGSTVPLGSVLNRFNPVLTDSNLPKL